MRRLGRPVTRRFLRTGPALRGHQGSLDRGFRRAIRRWQAVAGGGGGPSAPGHADDPPEAVGAAAREPSGRRALQAVHGFRRQGLIAVGFEGFKLARPSCARSTRPVLTARSAGQPARALRAGAVAQQHLTARCTAPIRRLLFNRRWTGTRDSYVFMNCSGPSSTKATNASRPFDASMRCAMYAPTRYHRRSPEDIRSMTAQASASAGWAPRPFK